MDYKEQIGIIVYGIDSRFRDFHVTLERSRGNVVVFCDGYARVHRR